MPTNIPNDPTPRRLAQFNADRWYLFAAAAIAVLVVGLAFFSPDTPNQHSADNQPAVTGPGSTSKQPTSPAPAP